MRILSFFILLLLCTTYVSSHATPTAYYPQASSSLEQSPHNITITFTERVEPRASTIRLYNENGTALDIERLHIGDDPRTFTAIVPELQSGVYNVAWQVVSADDGHFTRGAFSFAIGTDAPQTMISADFVHSASFLEGLTTSLELVGLALLLAALLVLLLMKRMSKPLVIIGVSISLLGTMGFLLLKSRELMLLQETSFIDALISFTLTTAGAFTGYRTLLVIVLAGILLLIRRRQIAIGFLILALIVILRARVSHAAASDIFPVISVAINSVHLATKLLWVAALIVLIIFATKRSLLLAKIMPLIILIMGVTGSYIIWLHLKSFHNILHTDWGQLFILMSIVGGILIFLRWYNKQSFYGAELVFGVTLLLVTGFMILSSPPTQSSYQHYTLESNGVTITLEPHKAEEHTLLLSFSEQVSDVIVTATSHHTGVMVIDAQERFARGYAIKIQPGEWQIDINGVRPQAYDAIATFTIDDAFFESKRSRLFTAFIIASTIAFIIVMLLWFRQPTRIPVIKQRPTGIIISCIIVTLIILGTGMIKSPFQNTCEQQDHYWHQMNPTWNYEMLTTKAMYGCMVEHGQFHFVDYREYLSFIEPVETTTTMNMTLDDNSTEVIFTVNIPGSDRTILRSSHERLMHTIIISESLTYFAHEHPQQVAPDMFMLNHTFPHGGKYLIAADFAVNNNYITEIFSVEKNGTIPVALTLSEKIEWEGHGYTVTLNPSRLRAQRQASFDYTIHYNGKPVNNLEPHLGAPMHIVMVKDDLSQFAHAHGEIGRGHHHALPSTFGPNIHAHLTFPQSGMYVLFSEFQHEGEVIVVNHTVHVS